MATWNIDTPDTLYFGPDPLNPDNWASGMKEATASLARELLAQDTIAIDTETTGLTVWKDYPLYYSVAWGNKRACLHALTLPYLTDVFRDSSKWWILANAKYDAHMLANVGHVLQGSLLDTQVAHSLLFEDERHGLKFMAKQLEGWTWGDFEDTFGKISVNNTPLQIIQRAERENFELLKEYAANDAWGTLKVYRSLRKMLENSPTFSAFHDTPPHIETLWDLFYKVEVPYTKTLWKMERWGIKVDRKVLEGARPQAEDNIAQLERDIAKEAGRPINISSTAQLKAWLIDERKLAPVSWTKGGKSGVRTPSVDAKFLTFHAGRGDVACQMIEEHRSYSKLLGTYINGLHKVLDPWDRIHTRYNQDVARTGRLSSSEPNLQNIPRPENDHWGLRKGFIAEDGYEILDFDYGQLEMRLLAEASGEQAMIDMINAGKDIHIGNTEIVFGVPYEEVLAAKDAKENKQTVTDRMKELLLLRNAVKSIGFGIIYGMGEERMAGQLGITREEAAAKIKQFLAAYPAVEAFTKEAVAETERTGYAFTLLGRRRNIPEIHATSRKDRGRGERLAVNTQIQGSAADVVKMAQIMYDMLGFEREYGCRAVLQVHDELVFECPKEHSAKMKVEIREMMMHPFSRDFRTQLEADGGVGPSWGDAK